MIGYAPADDGDYTLERLIQTGGSPAEIASRVCDLCNLQRGEGLQTLAVAVASALPAATELGQLNCMEALCALCNGGMANADAARHLANAVLLTKCGQTPCTP